MSKLYVNLDTIAGPDVQIVCVYMSKLYVPEVQIVCVYMSKLYVKLE